MLVKFMDVSSLRELGNGGHLIKPVPNNGLSIPGIHFAYIIQLLRRRANTSDKLSGCKK